MSTFEAGQKVTVTEHYYGPSRITTVAKVGKLKMTLADGSEWQASGWRRWGSRDQYYTGSSVRAYSPDDDEKIFRRSAVQTLGVVKWDEHTTDTLRAVMAAIKNARLGEPGVSPASQSSIESERTQSKAPE